MRTPSRHLYGPAVAQNEISLAGVNENATSQLMRQTASSPYRAEHAQYIMRLGPRSRPNGVAEESRVLQKVSL